MTLNVSKSYFISGLICSFLTPVSAGKEEAASGTNLFTRLKLGFTPTLNILYLFDIYGVILVLLNAWTIFSISYSSHDTPKMPDSIYLLIFFFIIIV